MDVVHVVRRGVAWPAAVLEQTAGAAERPRLARWVDPLDVAGHASRTLLPNHPTPLIAHGLYFTVLGALAVAEVVEPPLALVLAASHLMLQSHNRYMQQAGEAVQDSA